MMDFEGWKNGEGVGEVSWFLRGFWCCWVRVGVWVMNVVFVGIGGLVLCCSALGEFTEKLNMETRF